MVPNEVRQARLRARSGGRISSESCLTKVEGPTGAILRSKIWREV